MVEADAGDRVGRRLHAGQVPDERGRHQHDQDERQGGDALVVGLDHSDRIATSPSSVAGWYCARPEGGERLGRGEEHHDGDDDHGGHAAEVGAEQRHHARGGCPTPTASRMLRPSVPPARWRSAPSSLRRVVRGCPHRAAAARGLRRVSANRVSVGRAAVGWRRSGRPSSATAAGDVPRERERRVPGPAGADPAVRTRTRDRPVRIPASSTEESRRSGPAGATGATGSREAVGLDHQGVVVRQIVRVEEPGLTLHVDDVVVVVHHGAHRRDARRRAWTARTAPRAPPSPCPPRASCGGAIACSSPLPRSRMAGTWPVGASFQCGMSGFSSTTGPVTSWTALPAGSAPMMRTRPSGNSAGRPRIRRAPSLASRQPSSSGSVGVVGHGLRPLKPAGARALFAPAADRWRSPARG